MWKLKRFLGQYKKHIILGPFFKWTEAVLELLVPLVMARIIDEGVSARDGGYVLWMGGLLVLIAAVSLGCALVCQYYASIASQGVGTSLRREMFRKVNDLSHAELDAIGSHSLITRITNDVNQLQLAVAMLIRLVVRAPFLAIGAVVMAFTIDVQLSLIFVIAFPLIVLVLYLVMSRSVPFFQVMQKKLDRISLLTRENLEGARVIRAFSKQNAEQRRFEEASDDVADTAVRVGRLSALLNPLTMAIMNAAIIAILWFGGFQVDTGRLTQGEIVALVNYMNQILLALTVVANLVVIFTKASASAARVNEVLEMEPSVREEVSEPAALDEAAPLLAFEDVSFSYPGSAEPALSGISLTLNRGETLGVIGGTGSGKSTFPTLFPPFFDPPFPSTPQQGFTQLGQCGLSLCCSLSQQSGNLLGHHHLFVNNPLSQINGIQLCLIFLFQPFFLFGNINKGCQNRVFFFYVHNILQSGKMIFGISNLFSMDILMSVIDPLEIRRIDQLVKIHVQSFLTILSKVPLTYGRILHNLHILIYNENNIG